VKFVPVGTTVLLSSGAMRELKDLCVTDCGSQAVCYRLWFTGCVLPIVVPQAVCYQLWFHRLCVTNCGSTDCVLPIVVHRLCVTDCGSQTVCYRLWFTGSQQQQPSLRCVDVPTATRALGEYATFPLR
jgi:hypothetical protein